MDWTKAVFLAMDWLWLLLGVSCLSGSALLATGRVRLEGLERYCENRRAAPTLVLGLAAPALLALFKVAQYCVFFVFGDSANLPNVVWEVAHGHGFTASFYAGKSFLSQHISFSLAALVPLVWLWESTAALAAAHGAALGAAVWGFFLLNKRMGGSALLAWLASALLVSHALFSSMAIGVLELRIFAPAVFFWAANFWETGRRKTAATLGLVLLGIGEQVPFLFFGLSLYGFARATGARRRWLAAGLMLGSAALFAAELSLIIRARQGASWLHSQWQLFAPPGASVDSLSGLPLIALRRPWVYLAALVWPPIKLWTAGKALLGLGLLPLFSGWALAAALISWLPQQLADSGSSYHQLVGPEAAVVFAPLAWCCACALARLYPKADLGRRRRLASWVLGVAGFGFLTTGSFAPPEGAMPRAWKSAVPHAAAHIPRDAKLWCDPYLTPHFAMREHIKFLPNGPDAYFETGLFAPDAVLLSTHWIARCEPKLRGRLFAFLEKRGFVRVFQEADLSVLADPRVLRGQSVPLEWIGI